MSSLFYFFASNPTICTKTDCVRAELLFLINIDTFANI